MNHNDKRVQIACYFTNIASGAVCNLSPLLFLTFNSLYGIDYALLGLLVLINFFTQLGIDLIFSFFSHKFNVQKTVRIMPLLTITGFIIYAIFPFFAPNHVYLGLVLGTIVFSLAGGLAEVLISPIIAALPNDNPERAMSKLHSIYAWGAIFTVVTVTVFLLLFGRENWQWVALVFTLPPLFAAILFFRSKIPTMPTPEKISGTLRYLKNKELWLCVIAIFLGGASECGMGQWCSSYLEQALQIPKFWGDIFGVALFSLCLAFGRTLYAKRGKNIEKNLFFGAIGATLCYATAVLANAPILGLLACGITGFCVAMLWPGSLVVIADRIPDGGVFIYAMMAAGGDCGAAVGPQLMGLVTETVVESSAMASFAQSLGLSVEQLGMKAGMAAGMIFPLLAIFVYFLLLRSKKKIMRKI